MVNPRVAAGEQPYLLDLPRFHTSTAELTLQAVFDVPASASLLNTTNPRERLGFFRHRRHTVRVHDHDSFTLVSLLSFRARSRASLALVLIARRRQVIVPKAAAPPPPSALLNRPFVLGARLSTEWPQYPGTCQTGNCGLLDLLAMAVTPSREIQDEGRNSGSDPSDERRQSALGRASHKRTASARPRAEPGHRRIGCAGQRPYPGLRSRSWLSILTITMTGFRERTNF